VAVLVLHNLAVHRLLPPPADAALNLVTAAGLTAFARHAGCGQDELGIRAANAAAAGLRLGLAVRPARSLVGVEADGRALCCHVCNTLGKRHAGRATSTRRPMVAVEQEGQRDVPDPRALLPVG
jgi:hypothetical protein